jgi:hypothetical protein
MAKFCLCLAGTLVFSSAPVHGQLLNDNFLGGEILMQGLPASIQWYGGDFSGHALVFTTNSGGIPGNFTFDDVQIAAAPVPEPATVAFVGLGILIVAGISFLRRSPK